VFYASAGPQLTLYSVDVDNAALVKRDTVSTAGQYPICLAASLEAVSLCRLQQWRPGFGGRAGNTHVASAFRIEPATGALTPHGATLTLPSRPIHTSVDIAGEYLLTAYNDPSNLTVHRINKPTARWANASISPIRSTPANTRTRSVSRPTTSTSSW
jgi:6-phosphogluconolactonase